MAQQAQRGLLPPPPLAAADDPAAVAGGRAGGGNRRRAGRGGGGGRGPRRDVNVGPPRLPAAQPPTGAPQPRHLSRTATPDKNDPLWTDGLGGAELAPLPTLEYVYSGAEALPRVTSVLHSACQSASGGYSRRVPESALAYYCAVTVYARMLQLQLANGLLLSVDEARFVEQVSSLQLQAPLLLAHYLSGFGNTRVPSGRDVRFRMANRPDPINAGNVVGWFGRVSADTQPLYQNYPCLAVYAARIKADLFEGQFNRSWNLPNSIVPDYGGGRGPTAALLGYAPRSRLSPAGRAFLEDAQITSDGAFPTANHSLPLALDLLLAVQNELEQVSTMKLSPLPTAVVGSQAQLCLVRVEDEMVPIQEHPNILECGFRLPTEISFSASAFAYRVFHRVDRLVNTSVAPWSVWRYTVPASADWQAVGETGNAFREPEPELLQVMEFRTTPYLMKARLEALERAFERAPS